MKLYDIAYEPIEIVRRAVWPIPVLIAVVVIAAVALILVLRKRKKTKAQKKDEERTSVPVLFRPGRIDCGP